MTRGDDVHVGSDHDMITDLKAAQIIKRTALIDEYLVSDPYIQPLCRIKRGYESEGVINFLTNQFAKDFPHSHNIVEGKLV